VVKMKEWMEHTQEGEGLAGVGDPVCEHQGVSPFQNMPDPILHRALKQVLLAGLWTVHLEQEQEPEPKSHQVKSILICIALDHSYSLKVLSRPYDYENRPKASLPFIIQTDVQAWAGCRSS